MTDDTLNNPQKSDTSSGNVKKTRDFLCDKPQAGEWWIVVNRKTGKVDEGDDKGPYNLVAKTQKCVHVIEKSAEERIRCTQVRECGSENSAWRTEIARA